MHHLIWFRKHSPLTTARTQDATIDEKYIIEHAHTMSLPLLYGILPKMALLPNSPWWCNDVIDHLRLHPSSTCKELFGIDHKFTATGHPLIEWLAPVQHLDAQTAFRRLTGEGVVLEAALLPMAVQGDAPDDPNCFSDGSFTKPAAPEYGLDSAAVWYPSRPAGPSVLEDQYGLFQISDQEPGVALLGYLGGYRSSSSRIELVGTIMSMLANFPVHLAGDNLAVVNKASDLRAWLLDNPDLPPPGQLFALGKNSDSWSMFFQQLAARGPRSFKFKKTKGHALEHQFFRKIPAPAMGGSPQQQSGPPRQRCPIQLFPQTSHPFVGKRSGCLGMLIF